jgi:diguanylate cyclase (GGDEF)-like protein
MAASLRRSLIVPYALLVIALGTTIGIASYRSGSRIVETLLTNRLMEMADRIGLTIDRRVALAARVLDAAFPEDLPAPVSVRSDMEALRTRFWLATATLRPALVSSVYYGAKDGQYLSVQRLSERSGQLDYVPAPTARRQVARFTGTRGALSPFQEWGFYDVRERPWYQLASEAADAIWTPVYVDARGGELVTTRARRVKSESGEFGGVVAVDVSLKMLDEDIRHLRVTRRGLAFIMEPDGTLIASSASPYLKWAAGGYERMAAAESSNPVVAKLAASVRPVLGTTPADRPGTLVIKDLEDGPYYVAFERVTGDGGLNWIVVVAGPRGDFMDDVRGNVILTVALALVAVVAAILIGFVIVGWVTRDLGRLADAAQRVGEGELDAEVGVQRSDEIGALAKSFEAMQRRLRTDRLTGIANRETLVRRVDGEAARRGLEGSGRPFGVLFVDVNRFKQINDEHGHDAGDKVLIEIAQRLTRAVRPSDLVARYAGDEFVAFIDDVVDDAVLPTVCERIDAAMSAPIRVSDTSELQCSVSIGGATYPRDGRNVEALLVHADEEMYRRKFASRS